MLLADIKYLPIIKMLKIRYFSPSIEHMFYFVKAVYERLSVKI